MMLIDFHQAKMDKFLNLAGEIVERPSVYIQFDSVSDFYKAPWLAQFPSGTHYCASGLDDGAEEFEAVISFGQARLYIHVGLETEVCLHLPD